MDVWELEALELFGIGGLAAKIRVWVDEVALRRELTSFMYLARKSIRRKLDSHFSLRV